VAEELGAVEGSKATEPRAEDAGLKGDGERGGGVAAMILSAGLGTRLRPLTEELPKPLMWLGDRPVVAHIAGVLAGAGVRAAVLNTHHLGEAFRPEVLASLPLALEVIYEPEILGTAGGVKNAERALGPGDVVVWNGDIVAAIDVGAAVASHRKGGALATLVVAPRAAGEGTVGLGEGGEVVRLRGERFGIEVSGGDFVGVQVIGEALRRALPRQGCLVGDGYLPALRSGGRIGSVRLAQEWSDIGTAAAYLDANARWLKATNRSAYQGLGATVAQGVDVSGSVIGAGAVVEGEGALRGCVVWPGARARAPLERAVVTAGGRVARA
jgi:mannose-1-phosphate guanylyltransferase